jgi:hypothetical protein
MKTPSRPPLDDDDNDPFNVIVRDPSKPSRELLPPLGMILSAEDRAFVVERYGEEVMRDWERRNAEFLAGGENLRD